VGHYIRWQAIIAGSGIVLLVSLLFVLTVSRTTVVVPDFGGTYVEGLAGAPQYVNPVFSQYNQVDQDLVALIFNGLTRADPWGEPQPDLAADWTISEDGLVYIFHLRDDVHWHDGVSFTADDVLFTISVMQDPGYQGPPYLADLWRSVQVEKEGDYTVRFTLQEPFLPFLDYTTIGILPSHLLAGVAPEQLLRHPFNTQPVGTGPFQLAELTPEHALLTANRRYHGPTGYIGRIEFRFYPDYQSLLPAYERGEIMGLSRVLPRDIERVRALPDLQLFSARLSGYTMVYLNLRSEEMPLFQEVEVRRALLMGLDRQRLIDEVLKGQGLVADSPILPDTWAYTDKVQRYPYDPEKANGLLDQTGWVDSNGDGIRDREGNPFSFTILTSDDPIQADLADAIAEQWLLIGVQARRETAGATLTARLRAGEFEAALIELLISGDPDPYPLWHQTQSEGGQNYAGYDNSELSAAIEEARRITDLPRRKELYERFQEIFTAEVPALLLYYPIYTYAVDKRVAEVQLAPLLEAKDRFRNIADWYMVTKRVIVSEAQKEGRGAITP
jgi:peptide/nickel transport system substrate-binding protein